MVYHSQRRAAPPISHLAYADDIIIFTQAKRESLEKLKECLDEYCTVSGQMINFEKSNFYLNDHHVEDWQHMIREVGGFQRGTIPFTYLGVPIYKGRKKHTLFLELRQRISNRIHSWSHRHLTFGGRLALIKSTLSTIPLHVLQAIQVPKKVLHGLEQLMARYFWGAVGEEKKIHWVSWKQICLPVDEGGLGIRRLSDMVTAFSYKLWWRFQARDSLWARYLWQKYSYPLYGFSSSHSTVWRRLLHVGIRAHEFICWSLGAGRVSFWDDSWFGDYPLAVYRPDGGPRPNVSFFWHDSAWDLNRLHAYCAPYLSIDLLVDVSWTPVLWGEEDVMRWTLTSHGGFTVTSAWDKIRYRRPKLSLFGDIWSRCLTPTISVFLWRLLLGRIPIESILQSRGISLASMCQCCSSPQVESIMHVFEWSESARAVWSHFSDWFPAQTQAHTRTDIARSLGRWRHRFPRAPCTHVSFLVPCLVIWFIWTERNSHKHRGVPFHSSHVIWQVTHHLQTLVAARLLLPAHWAGCRPRVPFMPTSEPVPRPLRSRMVRWLPPEAPWVKLNTDGSFDTGTGLAAAGGLVRDHNSELLRAYCSPVTASSSFEAELLALLHGLELATMLSSHIWIEMDASAVVTLLTSGRHGSAATRHILTRIRLRLRGIQARFSHIHREGNKPADFMARRGLQTDTMIHYDSSSAPRYFLALVRMDQLGYPNFRFRYS